ncbi:MAG: HdeD family acid-resistance protein [Actinomycetota bacterium]|nr:MAG: HdeD family acid-resistance protein [Actinomycetota bacterium]
MTTVDPVSGIDDEQVRSVLAGFARHWGLVLLLGLATAVLGIICVVWPSSTLLVIAILFGAWLLVSGVFQLVASFDSALETGARVLLAIIGVLSIVLGIMCFRSLVTSVEILAIFIGIGWLLRGIMQLVAGIGSPGAPGRGWMIFGGILLAIGGVVILVWPGLSLATLVWVGGIWLIVLGVFEIISSFFVRKAAKELAAA